MKLINKEIYTYANNLLAEFNNTSSDLKLPIKLNFYLQKNIQILKKSFKFFEKVIFFENYKKPRL